MEGVVVVVPSLSKRKERDPPKVTGIIVCFIAAIAPFMGRGIDKPGGVIQKNHPHRKPPYDKREPSPKIEEDPQGDNQHAVVTVQEPIKRIPHEVRDQLFIGLLVV